MPDAATLVHNGPSKTTWHRSAAGPSVVLATAALAFVAATAMSTAILGTGPHASSPAAGSQVLDVRQAAASMSGFASQDTSVPDASQVFAGGPSTVAEPTPTF